MKDKEPTVQNIQAVALWTTVILLLLFLLVVAGADMT
ncbi:MAG: hypothetical protein FD123_999 [Bacteroidetes bacterium]|nr:MAG: hypothetical protein FD123_999 [Bacteroidota bacterium]